MSAVLLETAFRRSSCRSAGLAFDHSSVDFLRDFLGLCTFGLAGPSLVFSGATAVFVHAFDCSCRVVRSSKDRE